METVALTIVYILIGAAILVPTLWLILLPFMKEHYMDLTDRISVCAPKCNHKH